MGRSASAWRRVRAEEPQAQENRWRGLYALNNALEMTARSKLYMNVGAEVASATLLTHAR